MENIHLDFEHAKVKHLLFKSKLRSILYGGTEDETPILSSKECTVGKWIYSHALKAYGYIPEMVELEKVHAEIHVVAQQLLDLYKEGKVSAARIGLTNMEKVAERLINLLSIVERKAIESAPYKSSTNRQDTNNILEELNTLTKTNNDLDQFIRQHSGQLLHERQVLYEVLMQLPATIAILQGPEHVFEFANPAFLNGFPDKNILGKTVKEVLPSLEGQGFFELVDRVYKTGEPFNGKELPISVVLEDGTSVGGYINLNYQALRDELGEIDGVISFSYDVTEMVLARKKAQENEERFRFMSDAMPVQTWTANEKGDIEYVNKQWETYFGKSAEELLKEGWHNHVFAEDLPVVSEKWNACTKSLLPFEAELRLRNKEGVYRWHLLRANAFTNVEGRVQWYGTNTDIHDMKQLQDKLKQSYEDLEVKVKFRSLELERTNKELQKKLDALGK
ncbi:MAG TPA: PAS domain-containing protein [Flavisolibacter sp.]|nr:PAS domain-containing protein [Flavisolibacter sp.]